MSLGYVPRKADRMIIDFLMNFLSIGIIYFVSYMAGYPINRIVLKENMTTIDLILTPWLGISLIMIVLSHLSKLGVSIATASIPLITAITIIFLVVLLAKKMYLPFNLKQVGGVILFFIITTIYFTAFSVLYNDGLPVLLRNPDFTSYLQNINYAVNSSAKDVIETTDIGIAVATSIAGPQTRGCIFVIGFFSCLLGIGVEKIAYLSGIYFFAMLCLAFYPFFKLMNLKFKYAVLGIFFVFMNCNYQGLLFHSFLGQLPAVGLTILVFYIFTEILSNYDIRTVIIFALLVLAVSLYYPEGIPYIGVPIVICLIFFAKNRSVRNNIFKLAIATLGIIAIIDYSAILNVLKVFLSLNSIQVGWEAPLSFILETLGLINADNTGSQILGIYIPWISLAFTFIFFAFVFKFLYNKKINREISEKILLIILLTFTALYVIFIAIYWGENGYKLYKASVNIAWIYILMFINLLNYFLQNYNKLLFKVSVLSIIILFSVSGLTMTMANFISSRSPSESNITTAHIGTKSIIDHVNDVNDEARFFINVPEQRDEMYIESLLQTKKYHLISLAGFWGGHKQQAASPDPNINDAYIMSATYPDPIKVNGQQLLSNDVYRVISITDKTVFCIEKTGLGDVVKNFVDINDSFIDTSRKFVDKEVDLKYYALSEMKHDVKIGILNLSDKMETLQVILNGTSVGTYDLKPEQETELFLEEILFVAGENSVQLNCGTSSEILLTELKIGEQEDIRPIPIQTFGMTLQEFKTKYTKGDLLGKALQNTDLDPANMRTRINMKVKEINLTDEEVIVPIEVTNLAGAICDTQQGHPINLGVHLINEQGEYLNYDFGRVAIEQRYWGRNETLYLNYTLDSSKLEADIYYLEFQVVQEDVAWFPAEYEGNVARIKVVVE